MHGKTAMAGNFLILFYLSFLWTKGVSAQSTNQTVFAFPDFAASVGSTATKTFTTTIAITSSNTSFNQSIFQNAVTSFYLREYPPSPPVVTITSSSVQATGQGTVTYQVSYNYTEFTVIAWASDDTEITSKIGTNLAIKAGLETDVDFVSLYTVQTTATDVFSFAGNSICPSATCSSGNTFCVESSLGLSPMCRSVCSSTFVCNNGGACVHNSPTTSPLCHCPGQSSTWLIGGRCEYRVEAWMIAIFVIGFFGLIFLIILVGYCCCKERRKKTKPMNVKKTNEEPIVSNNKANNDILVSSPSHARTRPEDEFTFEHDTRSMPRSQMNPVPLETVIESSSESNESSQDPGFYEESSPRQVDEPVVQEVTRPTEEAAAGSDTSGHESSSSSDSESEENPNYSAAPEIPARRYDSLQFSSHGPPSPEGFVPYDHVQEQSGNKETQTNTRINIELPDSILMQPI